MKPDGKKPQTDKKRKERGVDFRTFFNLPKDKLVDDFSCAFQGGTTFIQGRLYVSDKHVCFGSIFSEKQVMVSYSSIISINKKTTAYVFPNAIEVVTKKMTFFFTSLIYRDTAFDALNASWQAFLDQDKGSQSSTGSESSDSGTGSRSGSDSEHSSEEHSSSGEETDTGSGSEGEEQPALTQPELDRVKAALAGPKKDHVGAIPEVNKANQTLPTSQDHDVLFQSLLQMNLEDFWKICWSTPAFYERLASDLELSNFKIQDRWKKTGDLTQYRKCKWIESEQKIVQTQLCRRLVPTCLEIVLHTKNPEKGIFQRWEVQVEDLGLRFSASLWSEGSSKDQLTDAEKTTAMEHTTNFLLLLHTMNQSQSSLPENVSPRKVALPIPVLPKKTNPQPTPDASQKRRTLPEITATPPPTPEKIKSETPSTPVKPPVPPTSAPVSGVSTPVGSPLQPSGQHFPPSLVAGGQNNELNDSAENRANETRTSDSAEILLVQEKDSKEQNAENPPQTPSKEASQKHGSTAEEGGATPEGSGEQPVANENNGQSNEKTVPGEAGSGSGTPDQKEGAQTELIDSQEKPELTISSPSPEDSSKPASAPIPISPPSTSPRPARLNPTPPGGVGGSPQSGLGGSPPLPGTPLHQTPPRFPINEEIGHQRSSSSRPRYPSPPKPVPPILQENSNSIKEETPLPKPDPPVNEPESPEDESDEANRLGKQHKRRQSRTESTLVKEDTSPLLQNLPDRSPLERLSRLTDNISKFYSPNLLIVILVVIFVVFLSAYGRLQSLEMAVKTQIEGTKVDTRLIERVLFLQYMANLIYNGNHGGGGGLSSENHYLGTHKEELQQQLEDWKVKSTKILNELKDELRVEWLNNFEEIQREASAKASISKLPLDIKSYEMSEYSWFYLILGFFALLPAFALIYMSASAEPTPMTVVRRNSDIYEAPEVTTGDNKETGEVKAAS